MAALVLFIGLLKQPVVDSTSHYIPTSINNNTSNNTSSMLSEPPPPPPYSKLLKLTRREQTSWAYLWYRVGRRVSPLI